MVAGGIAEGKGTPCLHRSPTGSKALTFPWRFGADTWSFVRLTDDVQQASRNQVLQYVALAPHARRMARQQITPEQHSVRVLKVGERVRHVLSEILTRQQVHDDTLSAHSVSVTEVRMSPDLRLATAFVKPLLGADEAAVLKALQQNTAFFQKEVARNLGLKSAAKLRFRVDNTFEEADRIDRLLSDPRVRRDIGTAEEQ